eukprot:jgi/Mesen1/5963/ME000301S05091
MSYALCSPAQLNFLFTPQTRPARSQNAASRLRYNVRHTCGSASLRTKRPDVCVRASAAGVRASPAAPETGLQIIDHYGRLGLSKEATNADIVAAFESKSREVAAEQGLEEETARQRISLLQQSLDVLTSEEDRRYYDWSIVRSDGKQGRYVWPYEADYTQRYVPSSDLPTPMVAEDEEGTRKLGYFLLGWFVLSVVLSCTLH